jgi:two-component system phosphate regulon sensor histidine kinase PhoR
MRPSPLPPRSPEPTRLPDPRRRAALRIGSIAIGLGVVAWCAGVPVAVAVCLGATVAAAMLWERAAGCRAAAAAEQLQRRLAATREGQRGAEAQWMSLDLAHERLRSVFEALGEGVMVVDAAGEVVQANPAASRALDAPAQDPEGKVLWEVLTTELAQRARDAWHAMHRTEEGGPQELPRVRYSAIPCRESVFDLTAVQATSSRTGQDFGTVFLFVDSTRAHELQRLKDRFLSSVSHELRTPLTNICAYSEILRTMLPGESAEWPEFVRVIHEEGLQLSSLVDGMFDFLQLESGEAVFRNEDLDGAAVVRGVLTRFTGAARDRTIDLELVVAAGSPRLCCDRTRLEQVVRNLVDNALKFTPPRGRVLVSVGCRDEGWELRIEDTGPGVPPDSRLAVFEKFHQLRDHLTDKPSGTGLGLATSRAIIARFGGLIWCEDSPLGGAGFVVLLPAVGQPRLAAIGAGTGNGGGF